jgi:ribosomal protein S3
MFFNRRHNLFIDFIKISALLIVNDINIKVFSKALEQIFKILQKRSHNRFISFLKKYFLILINSKGSKIKGIKMIINGKLGGKPRSSTKKILVGSLPLKTVDTNTVFTKNHVYTPYGAYGFKLWIRYN